MDPLWKPPGPEAAEVVRAASRRLLADADGLIEALTGPAVQAQNDAALSADASLAREDRDVSHADLVHWLTSNIQRPGLRVEPYFGARTTSYIRDLHARGIAPDFTEGWRVGLALAWRRWLHECLDLGPDREVLEEVLAISAQSMAQYALDWVAALREAGVADALGNADAGAMAMIQLITNDASIPADFAEQRLHYRLARWHQGLVLWVDDARHAPTMDELVAAVRTVVGRHALIARASTTSRWLWVSAPQTPDLGPVEEVVAGSAHVQVSVGRAGHGLEGFRATHQDALAAQAMVVRLGSGRRVTAYADVELIDALTKDRAGARRFVTRTLGPLAGADELLREALLTYVQSGFSTTRAAAALYAHRNTVERRVSRANELSLVKVEDNPTHVAAALQVLDLAPDITAAPPV